MDSQIESQWQGKVKISNKEPKIDVISLPNASAEPQTVMVKSSDAAVAHIAMNRPRWSVYQTSVAKLQRLGQDWLRVQGTLIYD